MPRFVVLAHDHPQPHFDFMLEVGLSLRTWRIETLPSELATQRAEPLPDHRLAYLDYEGPVSGNRGHVTRVDSGYYTVVSENATSLSVVLNGRRLQGVACLSQQASEWQFDWQPEER